MNMKSITAFALASLVLAGTACSQGSDSGTADVQTVSADESASGSFNLNLDSEAAALDGQAAESSSPDDGIIRLDPKK
jgi:outer membrane murein-binding lipoprotein Lpp